MESFRCDFERYQRIAAEYDKADQTFPTTIDLVGAEAALARLAARKSMSSVLNTSLFGIRIMKTIDAILGRIGEADRFGLTLMRVAIAIVFLWIGALKFVPYEADSITPFVANNPVMSLFYNHPDRYKAHLTHEGQLVPAQREWQQENNTYGFSTGLGVVEIAIGVLVLLQPLSMPLGFLGALLAF
jgi:hypothetical protein